MLGKGRLGTWFCFCRNRANVIIVRQWLRLSLQSQFKDLFNPFYRMDFQTPFDICRYFCQIFDVPLGNQHMFDPATVSRQQFFLEASDRQHFAAQCDFAKGVGK